MCLVAASHRYHCGNCAVSEIKEPINMLPTTMDELPPPPAPLGQREERRQRNFAQKRGGCLMDVQRRVDVIWMQQGVMQSPHKVDLVVDNFQQPVVIKTTIQTKCYP